MYILRCTCRPMCGSLLADLFPPESRGLANGIFSWGVRTYKYFPPSNLWLVELGNSFRFDCQPRSTGDMGWPSFSAFRWEITFFLKYFFTCDPGNPIGPSWLWLARTLRARSIAWNPYCRPGHLHLEGTKQAGCGPHQRLTIVWIMIIKSLTFSTSSGSLRQAVTVSLNNVDDRSCVSTLRLLYSPTLLLLLLAAMARWPCLFFC